MKEYIFVKIGTGGSTVKGTLQLTGFLNKIYSIFLKCMTLSMYSFHQTS